MSVQLKIDHMGPIKKSHLALDGVTIMVGRNNTGKSFISRSLFLMIKGINMDETSFKKELIGEEFDMSFLAGGVTGNGSHMGLYDGDEELCSLAKDKALINRNKGPIKEVIYCDNPLFLNETTHCSLGEHNHKRELYNMLVETNKVEGKENDDEEIFVLFDKVFKGDLSVKDGKEFIYLHEGNHALSMFNTPNGIKAFLIIKTLLQNNYLNEGALVILDEPEIYFHPDWQLRYAQIIAMISQKNKVRFLISTGSIYFLEALEYYTKLYQVNTHFYLSDTTEEGSVFRNVTYNVGDLYESLLEPYDSLDLLGADETGRE